MDDEPSRERPRLECVGSFQAYEPEGQPHTIEIWTRFEAVHDRQRRRVHTGVIVLTTTDGRGVSRIAQGDYQLTDQPEVHLTSADPSAP
jgi:hypothetical protein